MTARMRLFKWRAIARRIAKSAPPGSAEQAVAVQFRDGLEDAMISQHEDHLMRFKRLGRGSDYHAFLLANSVPLELPTLRRRVVDLDTALDPAASPDPRIRINTLLQVFNAIVAGMLVITPKLQETFYHVAFDDPDKTVRAWALHLLDPEQYPAPEE